jgi:subtilisin family serine protease
VAGIIAAKTDNGGGIAGMSRTATIMPIKIFNTSCTGDSAAVAEGIRVAVLRGAHVINLSIGSEQPTPVVAERIAVAFARNQNRIVVAAAGNHTKESCGLLDLNCVPNQRTYPAAYPGVIGVAAADSNWNTPSFSNHGDWVDVSAPGASILSTMPPGSKIGCGSSYCYASGTSMASPHVAALAAMALAHCTTWWSNTTGRDNIIIDRIQRRASHYPNKDTYTGYGYIKPKSVLSCI